MHRSRTHALPTCKHAPPMWCVGTHVHVDDLVLSCSHSRPTMTNSVCTPSSAHVLASASCVRTMKMRATNRRERARAGASGSASNSDECAHTHDSRCQRRLWFAQRQSPRRRLNRADSCNRQSRSVVCQVRVRTSWRVNSRRVFATISRSSNITVLLSNSAINPPGPPCLGDSHFRPSCPTSRPQITPHMPCIRDLVSLYVPFTVTQLERHNHPALRRHRSIVNNQRYTGIA